MGSFLTSTFASKTGLFGVIVIVAGALGFIPGLGFEPNIELLSLGVAMLTIRHTLYKQDVQRLDPILDRVLGDKMSGVTQDLLIEFLEAEDNEPVGEVRKRARERERQGDGGS